jgi:hypothetical protein
MSRQFKITWPDFDVTVHATLADRENPLLCEQFWKGLPFETVFAASMSTGQMFKVPVPFILPDKPEGKLTFFPDVPAGTIVSLAYMGSLLVKYGIVVEPFRLPRLASISPRELNAFMGVAQKLRDAYFFTKVVNFAVFEKSPK